MVSRKKQRGKENPSQQIWYAGLFDPMGIRRPMPCIAVRGRLEVLLKMPPLMD